MILWSRLEFDSLLGRYVGAVGNTVVLRTSVLQHGFRALVLDPRFDAVVMGPCAKNNPFGALLEREKRGRATSLLEHMLTRVKPSTAIYFFGCCGGMPVQASFDDEFPSVAWTLLDVGDVNGEFGLMEQATLRVAETMKKNGIVLHQSLAAECAILVPPIKILAAVCTEFELTIERLRSPRRPAQLSRARHIAMALLRRHTNCSLAEIGDHLGGRDHTTVLHGIRLVEDTPDALAVVKRISSRFTAA